MCKRREIGATMWSDLFQVKRTKMCSRRPTIILIKKKRRPTITLVEKKMIC